MIQLEIDLLKQMFQTDLDIARRMIEVGNLEAALNALKNAESKIDQLKALPVSALPDAPAIDV